MMEGSPQFISFVIPGVPVPMPRVRVNRQFGSIYTPKTTTYKGRKVSNGVQEFRDAVALIANAVAPAATMKGPVQVNRIYLFPRQAVKVWKRKPMTRYRCYIKPDADNLDKLLFDSITRMKRVDGFDVDDNPILVGSFWVDDSQVCAGFAEKWHCAGDEQPGTYVWIRELASV